MTPTEEARGWVSGWWAAIAEMSEEHLRDHDPETDACHACAFLAGEYNREDSGAPAMSQALADGLALARLREALPTDGSLCLVLAQDHDGFTLASTRAVPPILKYHGATIAEAADACRASLEGK